MLTLEASHFQTHTEEGDSAGVCRCANDDDTVLKAECDGQPSEVTCSTGRILLAGSCCRRTELDADGVIRVVARPSCLGEKIARHSALPSASHVPQTSWFVH